MREVLHSWAGTRSPLPHRPAADRSPTSSRTTLIHQPGSTDQFCARSPQPQVRAFQKPTLSSRLPGRASSAWPTSCTISSSGTTPLSWPPWRRRAALLPTTLRWATIRGDGEAGLGAARATSAFLSGTRSRSKPLTSQWPLVSLSCVSKVAFPTTGISHGRGCKFFKNTVNSPRYLQLRSPHHSLTLTGPFTYFPEDCTCSRKASLTLQADTRTGRTYCQAGPDPQDCSHVPCVDFPLLSFHLSFITFVLSIGLLPPDQEPLGTPLHLPCS